MIWLIIAVIVVGYFIYQAIEKNTRNNALVAHSKIINSPAYIKKETEGKRLYVKRVFDIAEKDLKTRDNVTDLGVKLFPVDPRKNPESKKIPSTEQIEAFEDTYEKVMKQKQQVYNNAIKELDNDSFFAQYDFITRGENPYEEVYKKLNQYSDEITLKHDEVQSKIDFLKT
jgi:hypothetical protein